MARIIIADDGIEFDGNTKATRPLGGVESSVVDLAEELASRGHEVLVRNMCASAAVINGVDWAPIHAGGPYANVPDSADLYIANRGDKLLPLVPNARSVAFWNHNPAGYMVKARYLWKLWRRRPTIVFIGDYHATTLPSWVPDGGRAVIPYGLPEPFLVAAPASEMPGPRAIFTSNPLRSLDWLLDRWERDIQPNVADAELHVFSGAATYGSVGDGKRTVMDDVLDKAKALSDKGVVLRGPVPKAQLIDELTQARVMLYRGDINETYCLAVAEAQALGVPAVVTDLGSMAERVVDGETGWVAKTDAAFSTAACRLLTDGAEWRKQHEAALKIRSRWTWADAAEAFETLIPQT